MADLRALRPGPVMSGAGRKSGIVQVFIDYMKEIMGLTSFRGA
ncbi:hypothetical protein [Acetobacter sp. AN02]|nr:hypothetical protein [Acetobacter sp. AN02]